jgi:hypothetical protein
MDGAPSKQSNSIVLPAPPNLMNMASKDSPLSKENQRLEYKKKDLD